MSELCFCDHSFLSCNDILECRSHLLVNEGDLVTVARHHDGRGNLYCVIEGICRVAWSRNIPLSSYDDIERGVNTCLQDMYARFITELKPQVESLRGTNITKSSKGQVQTMELGLSIVLNSLKMYDFVCRCSFLFIDNNENERQLSQQQEILRKFLTKFDCLGFISLMLSEVLWRDWKNMLKSINVLGDRNTICPLYKKMELPEDFVDESLIVNLLFMDKESEDVVSLMELKRKHVGKIKSRPKLCRFLKKIGLRWMTSTIS